MEVVDQAADSVHLLIVSSQTFSLDERHHVLYHINSSKFILKVLNGFLLFRLNLRLFSKGLNQIGEPVLSKKEELVRILKSQPIDSNKIGKDEMTYVRINLFKKNNTFLLDEEYSTEYKNGVDFDFQLLVNGKSSSFRLALQEFFKSTFKRKYLILTSKLKLH